MSEAIATGTRPRVGFLGVGWIGRHRMRAVAQSGVAEVAAIADPAAECLEAAGQDAAGAHVAGSLEELIDAAVDGVSIATPSALHADQAIAALEAGLAVFCQKPLARTAGETRRVVEAAGQDAAGAHVAGSLEELIDAGVDGVAIATPSALHADQAIAALEAGLAVFCQKPLARTAPETRRVVDAARAADRLLGVDFSYRHTAAALAVREQVNTGRIGPVHAVDLVFHNAYGPDKAWFLDPARSGGGCAIDLGIHLVDLLLWTLGFPAVEDVAARRWKGGRPATADDAEDFCLAEIDLANGTRARLACSWFSHEGRDAVIEATFRGRDGAASLTNVGGSFYDFRADRREGTSASVLVEPPDEWGGRAAVDWARRLAGGARFDRSIEQAVDVAEAIDRVYGR